MDFTTAVANCPSRKLFAPMFRARWQNMQNIVNDSQYINLIPKGYKTYYQAYIQQWGYWASGFVPQLHRQDFFSVGMGYTVCDIMTKECMAGGWRIGSTNPDTKDFIEKWAEKELNNTLNQMFFFANSRGNAILVLTPNDKELYASVYPVDRVVFQIGRTGEITSILLLNRFIAGETTYYAREKRVMLKGKAYYKVELINGTLITSPSWTGASMKKVPVEIEAIWRNTYGNIEPEKWYSMPKRLRGLGCYNVKNKSVAVALADLPGYSDSTLHTALDVLYSIDYNYTQGQVDQYLGKSRTLIPKQMGGVTIVNQPGTLADGMTFKEATGINSQPLEDTFYTQIPDGNLNGDSIKPTFLQPDLRAEARKSIRDADIELLASKVGISASTLLSSLAKSTGTKTDDQISVESSVDEKTVENKRELAKTAINAMLCDVAYFYGCEGEVEIQWGRRTSNSARENQELMADADAGRISKREYLRRRWTDLSEEEIEKIAKESDEEQSSRYEPQYNDMNYFGEEVANDNSEQALELSSDSDRRGRN